MFMHFHGKLGEGTNLTAPIAMLVKSRLTAISKKKACDGKAVIRYASVPEEVTHTAITLFSFLKPVCLLLVVLTLNFYIYRIRSVIRPTYKNCRLQNSSK